MEMGKFSQFMLALSMRLVASWKSTFLGLVFALATDVLSQMSASANPYAHLFAAIVIVPFALYRDRHLSDGSAVKVNIPPALAIAFVFCFAYGASAQTPGARAAASAVTGTLADVAPSDPPPTPLPLASWTRFGGCFHGGKLCVSPTVALSITAINLSTKTIEPAFSPGVGVGLTYNPGQWYSVGVSIYANIDPGSQKASAAGMFAFLNGWARLGYSRGFIGDQSSRLLLGTGIDL